MQICVVNSVQQLMCFCISVCIGLYVSVFQCL